MKIGIIGSGAMGSGIAQVVATHGHDVLICDENKSTLDRASGQIHSTLNKLVEKQKFTSEEATKILSRLKFVTGIQDSDFKDCELIIEAVVEKSEVKQTIFRQLESTVSDSCILASNTSSLSITSIASSCIKAERVIGIHFFNPAPLMPLVEIIPGHLTSSETTEQSRKIISGLKKTVVLCKDTPGFIVNRIARPFYGEAMRIFEEGIADVATIDEAMRKLGGFKMGPFELTDMIGHDVNYAVTESVWKEFYFDARYKPSLCQKRLVEAKLFGRKSGKGFYDYHEDAKKPTPNNDPALQKRIFERILYMLVNEAADALYHGIASANDIDLAMTNGVNYPKGLLKWADEIGIQKIVDELDHLSNIYREDRYRASVILRKKASENSTFH